MSNSEIIRQRHYDQNKGIFADIFLTKNAPKKESTTSVSQVLPQSSFTAYKSSDGRYRWVGISSNSYQDRDAEWVTQKAQETDIDRMNANGKFGTLDWWHTKLKGANGRFIPLDIGDCTHASMIGRFRLESGTFRDEAVGAAFANSQKAYKMSLEFLYPQGEPVQGQYHHMVTIRRSVLPADAASNSLTGFATGQKEQNMSKKTYERLKAMAAENGVDAVLQAIAGVSELEETAKGLGLRAKEKTDFGPLAKLSDDDLDELAADIVALKEQRAQQPDKSAPELDMTDLASTITKAIKDGMQETTDQLTALMTNRTKEQVETDRKATELETQIKQLNEELTELKAGPKAAKETQANGYRPTRHNPGQPVDPQQPQDNSQDGFQMIADKAVNI